MYRKMFKTFFEWLISFVVGVVAPIAIYLQLIVGIVIADTIVGTLAAYQRKQSLTWKGLIPAFVKIILFCTTLLCMFHFERTFFDSEDAAYATKILASIIALVQMKSIDRNFAYIVGYSFWDSVISKIGSIDVPGKKKSE